MAIDPRQLRPGELCRLLNSTPLGDVISERQLHRHRTRAGYRVASPTDPNRVDLFRYTAWLAKERQTRLARPEPSPEDAYEQHRERKAREARALSLSGRDIGPLSEVADAERKASCARDFRAFCERYFPATFHLAWSPDHLRVIAKIEQAVLEGGLFAMAMPRGSGKTSLCETACLWAMLYGHRDFVALIGSDEDHAAQMLDSIKAELENSELLASDFPEVCHPIRSLEGIHQRAAGQILDGRPTLIGWTAKEIVLPTIEGSAASGAIIRVAGITGRIRGMKHKRADGSSVRPSLVLIDDPQTDESARSPSQCANRERVLAGAILGLAGPGQKIAGLMTLTVVCVDDMADRILDRDKHPAWQGERTKMVYSFPSDDDLWSQYRKILNDGLRSGKGMKPATAFYRRNRKAMDDGASVAWESRFNHDELSAIQHAMNMRIQDEQAFFAEYQNEPKQDAGPAMLILSHDEISSRLNRHNRCSIPLGANRVVAFVDVQERVLYYVVCAFEDDFTGSIVDYGTEPDQKTPYFTLREIKRTLARECAGGGLEASIYAGLERLAERIIGYEWRREDGASMRIDRCGIDANWGKSTSVIKRFCRQSQWSRVVIPCHGRGIGASSMPMGEWSRKRGERAGTNWRIPPLTGRWEVRHCTYDTNFWKSFTASRLATPMGDPGALTLYGDDPRSHRMLVDHLRAEYPVQTQGRGRSVEEWKVRAGVSDNHLLDCVVGCHVMASVEGVDLMDPTPKSPASRKRVKLSEIQARKRLGTT